MISVSSGLAKSSSPSASLTSSFQAIGESERLFGVQTATSSSVESRPRGSGICGIRGSSGEWSAPERHPDFGKGAEYFNFGISHDGTRLAYSEEIWDPNIWTIELPVKRGEAVRPVNSISSTRGESQPQFSPDGSRCAFLSDRSGTARSG